MLTHEEFTEISNKYSNMIYRLALGWLKNPDDASDITQDVLIKLFTNDKDFESEDHIKNWLMTVTINQCKKTFRSPWSKREDIEDYSNTIPFEQKEYQELFEAVMKLDRKYRVPLLMFYYQGYSTREIADFLKIPEKTVSTRIRRAKEKAQIYLMED